MNRADWAGVRSAVPVLLAAALVVFLVPQLAWFAVLTLVVDGFVTATVEGEDQ